MTVKIFINIWLDIWLYIMKMSGFEYVRVVHNYRNLRRNVSGTQIYSTKQNSLPELNNNLSSVIIDLLIKLILENYVCYYY